MSSFIIVSVRGLPHNPTSLFLFFSYCFTAEGADIGTKDCVGFFISVTLIGPYLNMLPRTMRSKYAADGHPTMLYSDLAFSASGIYRFVKLSLFY